MSDENVVGLRLVNKTDLPDKELSPAEDVAATLSIQPLTQALAIGFTESGEFTLISSPMTYRDAHWLLTVAQKYITQ